MATAGAGLAAVGLVAAVDPARRDVPLCPFHAMTAQLCPLCGSLRAVDHLAHGDIVAALHSNAVLVAVVPLVLALWLAGDRAGRFQPRGRARSIAIYAAAAGLIAFTILRNLPIGAELRPG